MRKTENIQRILKYVKIYLKCFSFFLWGAAPGAREYSEFLKFLKIFDLFKNIWKISELFIRNPNISEQKFFLMASVAIVKPQWFN